ncbi:MAG TPA: SDR family oxidoreductase [Verrucomicrobiae bacterium]|jgi:NAD(P)-dependent dehydrogenase (short-subunit alcohol dehydrogenase family)
MKIALTGSSSGIGKFLADSLETAGHEICRLARTPQSGFSFQCDVSDWNNLQTAANQVSQTWNSADALICCAGIQEPIGPAMQTDPVAWRKNFAVNLDGTFFAIRALYPLLQKSKLRGKVLCFSGGGSTSPRPNFAAYGVAKTGVVRLVETLATEWENERLDINAVAPGAIFTPMTEQVLLRGEKLAGKKEFESASRLSRDNTEKLRKVLGLVSFLLSEKSDGISGRLIAAQWDPWDKLAEVKADLREDIYTLRRVTPRERGKNWGDK